MGSGKKNGRKVADLTDLWRLFRKIRSQTESGRRNRPVRAWAKRAHSPHEVFAERQSGRAWRRPNHLRQGVDSVDAQRKRLLKLLGREIQAFESRMTHGLSLSCTPLSRVGRGRRKEWFRSPPHAGCARPKPRPSCFGE